MSGKSEIDVIPVLRQGERCRIWLRSARRRYDPAPRRLPELNVLICTKGRARYFINGQIVHFRPRAILIAQPGDSHFLVSESADADFIVAVLDQAMLQAPPIHPPVAFSDGTGTRVVHVLHEGMFREISDLSSSLTAADRPEILDIGIAWWLHRVWLHCQSAQRLNQDHIHPSVASALTLLRDDPKMSISDVAKAVHVSADHLSVLFRNQVGVSMIRHRSQLRLDRVERLVQNEPRLSLENAAIEAGFNDYSSFYRSFRKHRGGSPRTLLPKSDHPG